MLQPGVVGLMVRVGAALTGLAIGCGGASGQRCTALFERGAYAAAALRCGEVFEVAGDRRYASLAARAQQHLGRSDEALAWVERAGDDPAAADLWRLAADIRRQRGEPALALVAGRRELELRRRNGEHARASGASYELFYDAWAAADYGAALGFARDSLVDAERSADRAVEARALQALVMVLYEIGDLERARRVLAEAARRVAPEERADRARLLVYEGLVQLNSGRAALARDAFDRALALAAESDEPVARVFLRSTHLNLVKAHLELGVLERAEAHLAAAEANAEPGIPSPALLYYRSRVLHARSRLAEAAELVDAALAAAPDPAWTRDLEVQRGILAEARGDFAVAEAAYRRAADGLDAMRAGLGADELKSWLLDHRRRPFEALFRLQARSGHELEALATAERARARSFLDAFVAATSEAGTGGGDFAVTAGRRFDALDALLPSLRESPAVALGPIESALSAIGDRHLLLYVEAGDELWRFAVAAGRVDLQRLATTPSTVDRLVRRFVARPDDRAAAAALGELLLPASSTTPAGATLHVAADGALGTLPFGALRVGDRFLVEHRTIAYVPSLHAMAALVRSPSAAAGDPVVLGDPRGDLPWAALEAQQVGRRLGVTPRLGRDAGLAALAAPRGTGVLHLATHSGVGPTGPWITMAEGEVAAGTVVAGAPAPRLVVLATCASAARRGRGLDGTLGAAFLAAGSQAVLASLWSLEDRAAYELVLGFYDEGGSVEPAAALARAQRRLIAAGRPASSWAPVIVLGIDRLGVETP